MQLKLQNGKQVTIETSWDDGYIDDLKIATLLLAYKLPGTFYIPSIIRELTDYNIKMLSEDFEIGGHTETHRILREPYMTNEKARAEIFGCKEALENIIGKPVTSFCYPKGKYDQSVVDLVREAGFIEARTVDVLRTLSSLNKPFEKATTIHVFQRREYGVTHWIDVARDLFDLVMSEQTDADYFHIWGHSWEIERDHEWQNLESFFKYMYERIRTVA